MGRIQSNVGLISGINTADTITQLLAVSARPRDRLLQRTQSLQTTQTAITELTALVIGVQLSTDRLGRKDEFVTKSATTSASDVLKATATSSAVPGNYRLQTIQTSQTASATSNAFTSDADLVGAGTIEVQTGGFVDSSASLDSLRGGAGIQTGKIRITDRSGSAREIDLRHAVTIDDVVARINNTEGLRVTASNNGEQIILTDLSGQTTSNLKVEEVGDGRTAADLGLGSVNTNTNSALGEELVFLGKATRLSNLKDGLGVVFGKGKDLNIKLRDGTNLELDLDETNKPKTIGQLLDKINAADAAKLQARIASDGKSLELVDLTTGSDSFEVSDLNGSLARDLGLDQSTNTSTISGIRVQSGLSGPLLSSLHGGKGLGNSGIVNIRNRAGTLTAIDLGGAKTLRNVVDRINASGAGVVASLNAARTGIAIQDTTGSTVNNLVISDGDSNNTATNLQIAADVNRNVIDSDSLNAQFVGENTLLSELNQGRGILLGSVSITDSKGKQSALNLAQSKAETVGDVIRLINGLSIDVEARLNDAGDGITIIDTAGGTEELKIEDVGTGKAAKGLGIAGKGSATTIQGETKTAIVGSQNYRLSVANTDKISDIVTKINEQQGPLSASLLNAGPSSVRLLLTSRASGRIGRISIDGGSTELSFSTTAQARDAVLSIGSSDEVGGQLLRSSDGVFKNAITGLDLTLTGISDKPVDVAVSESSTNVVKNVQAFVDQYNKVRDKLKALTSFDAVSKSTGLLFGSTEALRLDSALSRFASGQTFGAGSIRSFAELGVSVNDSGKLDFDKSKLEDKLQKNPEAVKDFLTKAETGASSRAKKLLDTLVGPRNSLFINKSQALQKQIETNTQRASTFTEKLDREKLRLEKQFFNLEQTIAKLQTSQKSLASIQSIS